MKKIFFLFFFLSLNKFSFTQGLKNIDINRMLTVANIQYKNVLKVSQDLTKYPRTQDKNGSLKYVNINDWTGGFWAGNLWYMYELTKDTYWKDQAVKWTESLNKNQFNTSHHDLGFMMYCSYGKAYKRTLSPNYKDVLIQSAKSLKSRFNTRVGSIESWNSRMSWDGKTLWDYPVIIDNLMNLELLFFASKETGDNSYKDIAIKHAETALKNHIRPDFSSYHVINYDTISGKVLHRETCQGYADNSTWARGQAWGIYGYTMIYRETKDRKFLDAAIGLSDFFLKHKNLPKDYIPYWDFNVGEEGYDPKFKYNTSVYKEIPRDASAAAIVSSALLELCNYVPLKKKVIYLEAAEKILKSLSTSRYLARPGTNGGFLLKHSTGSFPHNKEVDVPLVYADYYYLEALIRYKNLNKI
ncbi:glycoside hydrolase family 88 protein [Pedobacter glucosidilyticus]|uniref:glycoside hydrolase family 88 protein n=1 Tax=Pedobacter glucosidilyticus TaxID=1122941 RepID=UPI00041E055F|nr:glycoside hydrolase family 88 protein [Pedobacter glucosidilyticus]